MKNPLVASFCMLLVGCTSIDSNDVVVTDAAVMPDQSAAVVEWIDVPLSNNTYMEQTSEYREGEYSIELAANSALEFMVNMLEGDVVVYNWTTQIQNPGLLTAEFHGHTVRMSEAPGNVMFYRIHNDAREQGMLKAPFSGVHGWYLNNESEEDIVVQLKLAGFYTE